MTSHIAYISDYAVLRLSTLLRGATIFSPLSQIIVVSHSETWIRTRDINLNYIYSEAYIYPVSIQPSNSNIQVVAATIKSFQYQILPLIHSFLLGGEMARRSRNRGDGEIVIEGTEKS